MANPLLMLMARRQPTAYTAPLRRVAVPVPTEVPSTDAIFLVLRRMRGPLIVLISTFSISVLGLMLIPGVDDQGRPHQLTAFDAFYVISYTATTIGFGELPYPFTTLQRMWVIVAIYASVVGWAYSIGALFALMQDRGFREAVALQRFRRRVAKIAEPFFIVAGYGQTGRRVCMSLDDLGKRFVVVDISQAAIDKMTAGSLVVDAPAIEGNATNPAMLGLAGLGHPHCAGVIALTDDSEANLSIVMSVNLLRPELPVYARADDREIAERMRDFDPAGVVNPYDEYGEYLLMALRRPSTYQLFTWFLNPRGTPLPPRREGLADGRWVIVGDNKFTREVTADFTAAGLDVTHVSPQEGDPDLTGAVGVVAGAGRDATNLAVAAHARREDSGMFISVRQSTIRHEALLDAFDPDSVFVPSQLVAREILARVIAPHLWSFLEQVIEQDDEWAQGVLKALRRRCGSATPETVLLQLDRAHAPSVVRWLRTHELTLRDLLRHPEDRTQRLPVAVLAIICDDHTRYAPDLDQPVRVGEQLLLAGRGIGFDMLSGTLFSDAAVEYVSTGRQVPTTWLFRLAYNARRRRLEG